MTPPSAAQADGNWGAGLEAQVQSQSAGADYDPYFQQAAQAYNLDPNILRSVAKVESGFNPRAVSSQGALGLMQIEPATAQQIGVQNPLDPKQAIFGAARYLREGYDRYGTPEMAVAFYHGGPDEAQWGPKTLDYVQKVTDAYTGYTRPSASRGTPLGVPNGTPLNQYKPKPDFSKYGTPWKPDVPAAEAVPAAKPDFSKYGTPWRPGKLPMAKIDEGSAPASAASAEVMPAANEFGMLYQPPAAPKAQPQILSDINSFKAGAVGGVGQALYGTGQAIQSAGQRNAQAQLAVMARIDKGESVSPTDDVMGYADMTPEQRAQTKAGLTETAAGSQSSTSASNPNALMRAGTAVSDYAKAHYPVAPENDGLQTRIAGGLGGMLPLILGSAAGTVAAGPVGGAAVGGTMIWSQTYGQTYQDAIKSGATAAQADKAALQDAAAQAAIMAVPTARLFELVPAPLREGFAKTLINLGTHGVEFGSVNAAATFAHNYVAQQTYKPDQKLMDGVGDAALEGTITGMIVPAATAAAHGVTKAMRPAPPIAPEPGAAFSPQRGPNEPPPGNPGGAAPDLGPTGPFGPAFSGTRGLPAPERAASAESEPVAPAAATPKPAQPADTGRASPIIAYAAQNLPGLMPERASPAGVSPEAPPPAPAGQPGSSRAAEPAVGPTTPEPAQDIHAQIAALTDPANPKDAAFVAAGNEAAIPAQIPSGLAVVRRPEGTLITNNAAKAKAFERSPSLTDGMMANILGYVATKEDAIASGQPIAVQARDPQGAVVDEALTDPAHFQQTQAHEAQRVPPGGAVTVTSPQEAQQRRAELVAQEQPVDAAGMVAPDNTRAAVEHAAAQVPTPPEQRPELPAAPPLDFAGNDTLAAPVVVEHVTKKGKTLSGYVRPDLTQAEAKAIDPYAFRKDNGWFIRKDRAEATGADPESQKPQNVAPPSVQSDSTKPATPDVPPGRPESPAVYDPSTNPEGWASEAARLKWSREMSWLPEEARQAILAAAAKNPGSGPVKTFEQKQIPAKSNDTWRKIGKNAKGVPVYEDERGVRATMERGILSAEPVGVRPDGTIEVAHADDKRPDYRVVPHPGAAEAAPQAASQPGPEASPEYGKGNKFFTSDAAEAARKLLREKLRNQLNAGFDPEIALAGLTLAGYHIEAGARKFADYARAMIGDLGEAARPHLRGWYEAVRHYPGFDPVADMSDPREVDAFLRSGAEGVTSPQEAGNGDQGSVRDGDARAGAEDVYGSAPSGVARPAPSGEGAGSAPVAGGDTEGRTEGSERPADQPGRAVAGGGNGEGSVDRVPAAGEPRNGRTAGRSAENVKTNIQGADYRIAVGGVDEARGPKTKARDNLKAIGLAKQLTAEGRAATQAEQDVLAKYVGWGGLKGAFPGSDGKFGAGFEDIGQRLKAVLTPDEHRAASSSTQYAHYTAEHVIRSMWDAVRRMGFDGGTVLEPGMGIGHFYGMMPGDLSGKVQYQGIERDKLTAQIAKLLYPEQGVRQADFTKVAIPEEHFDMVIGNPPFSDTVITADPKYAARGFMLHDYFFAKSLDSVRPGGLLAFVTSAGTMNKMSTDARHYLAERAEFVGGVRLPSSAFRRNAGTDVTTDLLFFKRRPEGRIRLNEPPEWAQTVSRRLSNADGDTVDGRVNAYFSAHPEQVLGQEGFFDKLYKDRYAVHNEDVESLPGALHDALLRLPANVMTAPPTPEQKAALDFASGQTKDGSFYIGPDGQLMQFRDGAGRPVQRRAAGVEGGMTADDMDRVRHLVPVRDALRDVFRHDLARNEEEGAKARAALNGHYDVFVAKFGPINKAEFRYSRPTIVQAEAARLEMREEWRNSGMHFDDGDFDPSDMLAAGATVTQIAKAREAARIQAAGNFREGEFDPSDMPDVVHEKRPNIKPFMGDPESYRLRSIEHYDDSTEQASKKDIFRRNILTFYQEPEIRSANDGVLWSLNKFGRFDVGKIAEKMGRKPAEVIHELGDAVFKDPGSGQYQTRDEYLSGDVVSKLEQARLAAQSDPEVRRNVAALEAAIPAPLAPSEISMTVGMPWIPARVIQQFAKEHLKIGDLAISHSDALGGWTVAESAVTRHGRFIQVEGVAGREQWGVPERDALHLLADAMNRTPPRIYRDGRNAAGKKIRVFDAVATQAAQDKVDGIKQAFEDWVRASPERADKLAALYNDKLNREVLRQYDGDYLTTPGVADGWSWRPHQRRVVSRIILSGNTYMAHAVGAGKTSAAIGAGMEMRRLGLVKKNAYVVPNHMLAQFTKEFYEQYPTARIMVADEANFHTDRRKQFIANVAQEDLDAVIITHSAFGKIPISDTYQDHLIQEEVQRFQEAIEDLQETGGEDVRISVGRLENMIEKLEQKLSGQAKQKQDQTLTFEQMGVDHLFVDEAHEMRKLTFATRQGNLKGIDPQGSNAAWDLYSKIRYLEDQRPGRSAVLMSGTPVTNTMGELFSISRILQPNMLRERGITHFDSWAQTFGDTKTGLEQDAAGGYKPVTRFAKFVNIPELFKMVGAVMDIVTPNQLEQYVVRPKLKGGERQLHLAPRTEFLDSFQAGLAQRMADIQARKGRPEKGDDILLSVINDGRHAAIDPRFVTQAQNDPNSKLNMMIDNVVRIWSDTTHQQFYDPRDGYKTPLERGPAAQMIFSNLGVNGRGPMQFSGYQWIKTALMRAGIPAREIAFIGDYPGNVQKQALFNDVNEGKVRILIGSTKKMGTGVNAQRRLIAVHNLDPLWFPADDEQRNGRILRQGNTNPVIEIHDYSTKGTYDSSMWQMMGRKGRFIEQFFRGDPELRDMEDLGEASMFEQAAAMATSDERVIKLTELKQALEKAQRRQAAHEREEYQLRNRIGTLSTGIRNYTASLEGAAKDLQVRQETRGDKFAMQVGGETYAKRPEAAKALLDHAANVFGGLGKSKMAEIGRIGGFPLLVERSFSDNPRYHLKMSGEFMPQVGDYASSPAGVIQSAEGHINGVEDRIRYLETERTKNQETIKELTPLLGKPFDGDAEIMRLRSQVNDLEEQLNPPKEAQPPPPEVAYQKPSETFVKHAPALASEVDRLLAKIAPGVKSEQVGSLPSDALGAYFTREEPDGTAHVVAWSLASPDALHTASHEVMHYLRRGGFFSPEEWTTLEKAAHDNGWAEQQQIQFRYPELGPGRQAEESISERYADWASGIRSGLPGALGRVFTRLNLFRQQVGAAARRIMGRDATPEDVFAKVASGEVGARQPEVREPETGAAFQRSAATKDDEAAAKSWTAKLKAPFRAFFGLPEVQRIANGKALGTLSEAIREFADDVGMIANPMAMGSDRAMVPAKQLANEQRRTNYHLVQLDKMIKQRYSADERSLMGRALDEQSVMDQEGTQDPDRGVGRLTKDQQALVELLNGMSKRAWQAMIDAEIVQGAGLPYYMPRYFVNLLRDTGEVSRIAEGGDGKGSSPLDPLGRNIRTAGPKPRKYLTPEETVAAARAKLGGNATLVTDIRAVLVALHRADRAVAGRRLIQAIREVGKQAAIDTVDSDARPGWFTIDHPSFREWVPAFTTTEAGKVVPKLDQNGETMFEQRPIFIAPEFEGPLRAILSKPPGALYQALMQIKRLGVSLIMLSPMTHNMVIFGKAFELMPGQMLTLKAYRDGNRHRKDPDFMNNFIAAGMVPINGGWMQDITGIQAEAGAPPGKSLISKGAGSLAGAMFGPAARDKTRDAIDRAGQFWHGTLLWDRIADLQAGIAAHMKSYLLRRGLSDHDATWVAAHLANRFAGVLPNESTSSLLRRVENLVLFSRSFTLGNLGIIKDAVTGLPSDVMANLSANGQKLAASAVRSVARRLAIGVLIKSFALFYGMNAIVQMGVQAVRQYLDDPSNDVLTKLGHVSWTQAQGFARRWSALAAERAKSPLDWLNPLDDLDKLLPAADNEPGKQDRIFVGIDHEGRAIYLKNPFGKVGEEFKDWLTQPITEINAKLSPFVRPLMDIAQNRDYFGHNIVDRNASGLTDDLKSAGRVVAYYLSSQVPLSLFQGGYDLVTGAPEPDVSFTKSVVPFMTGLTVSRGDPLGPKGSIMRQVSQRADQAFLDVYPSVMDAVKRGHMAKAISILIGIGQNPAQAAAEIRNILQPQRGTMPTGYYGRKFNEHATAADRERLENVAH